MTSWKNTPGLALFIALWVAALVPASVSTADESMTTGNESNDGYTVGYSETPVFGGPNSPTGQLEEDDRIKNPVFRFPQIDALFQPWHDWRRNLNTRHGVQVSGHYTTLYQQANSSPSDERMASSGIFRTVLKWTLVGRDTPDSGSLVITLDHRHGFREITPADLGAEIGYIGVTGVLYSDVDWVVPNLNWVQGFNNGTTGLLLGRYDPSDYMNILGYANPWVSFSNVAVLLDPSVAFADSSWGVAGGQWIEDSWYVTGGINDANGTVTDSLEFFDGGAEFYKWGEVGWSPSSSERYASNIHLTGWQVDEREDAGIDSAHGVAFAANWTFNDVWMPFVRAGWSRGTAPIYNRSASIGIIYKVRRRSDLLTFGFNWGDPPQPELPEQKTIEAAWNVQLAQNLAIAPSVQLLLDPAQNPAENKLWVGGLRFRLTF